jgi:hypothetical protein
MMVWGRATRLIGALPATVGGHHNRKLAAYSTISSARASSVDGIRGQAQGRTPINCKHGEDLIIAESAADEDAPTDEIFVLSP